MNIQWRAESLINEITNVTDYKRHYLLSQEKAVAAFLGGGEPHPEYQAWRDEAEKRRNDALLKIITLSEELAEGLQEICDNYAASSLARQRATFFEE